jgi:stress-induced-phosphoprotein 1
MSAVEELKAKGNKAFADKKYEQAITFYSDAIDMDDGNYTLYSNRSGSYCALRKYRQAEADARKVIQLKSDWARGHTRLGAALEGLGKWDDAVKAYEQALTLDPGNANIQADLENARQHAAAPDDEDMDDAGRQFFSPQMLDSLRYDPKVAPFFSDPSFLAMINDIGANSKNIGKYAGDPRMQVVMQALIERLAKSAGAVGEPRRG